MGRLLPVVTMVCFGLASLSSAPGADVYTDRGLVRAICIVHDRTSEISSAARKILEANGIAVYNVLCQRISTILLVPTIRRSRSIHVERASRGWESDSVGSLFHQNQHGRLTGSEEGRHHSVGMYTVYVQREDGSRRI